MPIPSPHNAATLPALALMLLLALAPDGARAQSRDVKLSGMGVRKCSEWLQWKESGNAESRAMVLEWTQGFIAGHNVYARTGTTAASPVVASVNVLIPLLDSYCQKNPGERILSGVMEITTSLGGATVNLRPKAAPNPRPENKSRLDS